MNVAQLGNQIYAAICGDPSASAKIRTEYKALALQLATDPSASARITSATVNGQTFTAAPAMTNAQRMAVLRWVVACLDNDGPISTTQVPYFT